MTKTNIIDSVIPQTRSRELVRLMIPILIRWAKQGLTDKTYGDMIHALGYTRYSGIGLQLGNIETVLKQLRKLTHQDDIPTLNALIKQSNSGLPSDGFDYVEEDYSKIKTKELKRTFIDGINLKAIQYKKWDWVLKMLEIKPACTFTDEELTSIGKLSYGSGGEGEEHKAVKEYIFEHPESLGISDINKAETEYPLPSGDRNDVYFELSNGDRIVVEVKPSTSPDNDITRGIFQCIKYKAVMEAIRVVDNGSYSIQTILVMVGEINQQNKLLAEELDVKYIDKFNK